MRRDRSQRNRRYLVQFGIAWLLLALSTIASADWMRDYDRGMRALEKGDFKEAEQHFRTAIRDKEQPAARQRFQGTRFEPYLPQHYAAVAAWKSGNCAQALDYWNHAELGSVLAEVRDPQPAADRARGMAECGKTRLAAQPAAETPAPAAAPTTGTAVPATSVASTQTGRAQPPAAPRPASSDDRPSGKPPVAAPTVASRSAPPAAKPAARGPAPAALVSAAEHYIAGRYGELDKLNPNATTDAAARAHLLMLRAAARYVQAELDGRGDAALDPVRADIRAAKQAQSSLAPDPALFPPRFRAIWQQTR